MYRHVKERRRGQGSKRRGNDFQHDKRRRNNVNPKKKKEARFQAVMGTTNMKQASFGYLMNGVFFGYLERNSCRKSQTLLGNMFISFFFYLLFPFIIHHSSITAHHFVLPARVSYFTGVLSFVMTFMLSFLAHTFFFFFLPLAERASIYFLLLFLVGFYRRKAVWSAQVESRRVKRATGQG